MKRRLLRVFFFLNDGHLNLERRGMSVGNSSMMNKLLKIIFVASISILSATTAEACGGCVMALFDKYLPPLSGWIVLGILWYLAVPILSGIHQIEVSGVSSVWNSLIIVISWAVVGLIWIGPLGFYLLVLVQVIKALYFKLPWPQKFLSRNFIKHLNLINNSGLLAVAVLIIVGFYIRSQTNDVDFIRKWSNTHIANQMTIELIEEGKKSLPKLENLMGSMDSSKREYIFQGMMDVLKNCKRTPDCRKNKAEEIEYAIRALNNGTLPFEKEQNITDVNRKTAPLVKPNKNDVNKKSLPEGGSKRTEAIKKSTPAVESNLTDVYQCVGCDLRNTDLTQTNLRKANLKGVDLTMTDLTGAILRKVNLVKANLSEANLSEAILWEVNLTNANLSGANLPEESVLKPFQETPRTPDLLKDDVSHCHECESQANLIAQAIEDYFAVSSHNSLPDLSDLNLTIPNPHTVSGCDRNDPVEITVKDASGLCPKSYQDNSSNWNRGVYTKHIR